MIYVEPGNRRADTMSIVSEGCAARHYVTGEFKLIAKACGYTELVMRNLAEFFEAGVIEPSPKPGDRVDNGDWEILRWTKTGHYLWKQWREGLPRRVVEIPAREERPAAVLPKYVAARLQGAGWQVLNVWRNSETGHLVVPIMRYGDGDEPPTERVLVLAVNGRALLSLDRAGEAEALARMLLAASS